MHSIKQQIRSSISTISISAEEHHPQWNLIGTNPQSYQLYIKHNIYITGCDCVTLHLVKIDYSTPNMI